MGPVEIPPGVVSAPTKSSSGTNWRETHLMRWAGTSLTPVGGWDKYDYPALASKIRKVHIWIDNTGARHIAVLCEGHIYVDSGSGLVDVSPTVTPIVQPDADFSLGGFGEDVYNLDEYGTARPNQPNQREITPIYTLDNWGEDLLVMTSNDGRLLRWSPSAPTVVAAAVPNAPISNRTFVVTNERHVIAFGRDGKFNEYAWCDQEDIENWTFADVTSLAGFLPVEPSAPIVTAMKTDTGILFFTTVKPYLITYKGPPYIYGHDPLTDAPPPASPAAIAECAVGVVWASEGGFWVASGAAISPLECAVYDWLTANYDKTYLRYRSCIINIKLYSELWFFFPSAGSQENDRYVVWNYKDGWWATGQIGRCCGFSSTYINYPIMADVNNIYRHEVSYSYPATEQAPYAETFPINVSGGTRLATFDRMMADVEGARNAVQFRLNYRLDRSTVPTLSAPSSIDAEGYVPFRLTGRDFRIRVESKTLYNSEKWTVGNHLVDLKPRGLK